MTTHRNSLYGRIEDFFRRNPDEVLRVEDICVKWGINRTQARAAITHIARRGGALVKDGDEVRGLEA